MESEEKLIFHFSSSDTLQPRPLLRVIYWGCQHVWLKPGTLWEADEFQKFFAWPHLRSALQRYSDTVKGKLFKDDLLVYRTEKDLYFKVWKCGLPCHLGIPAIPGPTSCCSTVSVTHHENSVSPSPANLSEKSGWPSSVLHCVCAGFFALNNSSYSPDQVVIVITGRHPLHWCVLWAVSFNSPLFSPPPTTQALLSLGFGVFFEDEEWSQYLKLVSTSGKQI